MKKLIYLAVIFSFQNLFAQSYNGWFFVNPKPQASTIISCDFLNQNTGYALCGNGTILKTVNAGTNWIFYSYIKNIEAKKLFILDETTFYIMAYNKLFKSTNAGQTFFQQFPYLGASYNDVFLVNATTGFLTTNSYILRTTNNGTNWIYNSNYIGNTYSIYFTNEQTGFITADGGKIYKTTNTGGNWTLIQTPANVTLNKIHFRDDNTGFAIGNSGAVLRTVNAGNNWTSLTSPYNADYRAIHFLNATSGFILCYKDGENHLIMTTDGGINWEYDDFWSFGPYEMRASDVFSNNTAVLLGDYGQMYRSSGLTFWSSISSVKYTHNFTEMKFFDANTGYAVDDTARVFRTVDGGNNWDERTHVKGLHFSSMGFIDINTGFVFGTDKSDTITQLYRTTNGAQTWTRINFSSKEEHIYKMVFPNPTTGYMVGVFAFYKTSNAGINWSVINTRIRYSDKIQFVNDNTGFFAKESGDSVLKTTDGGVNWIGIKGITDTSQRRIYDLDFFNANTGLLISGGSFVPKYIFKTTTGGNSWDSIIIADSMNYFTDAKFLNLNKGFISTYGGLYTTTNGGSNWNFNPFINGVFSGYYFSFASDNILFVNDNTGYIYGYNGYLAKTTTGGSVFINNEVQNIPTSHMLFQNYPNPFNPSTTISFYLKKPGLTKLNVYDISGRHMAELINENRPSGFNHVTFNSENLSSGVYFYKLETDDYKESKKMVLIK